MQGKRAGSRTRKGRALSEGTAEWWERITLPWREGDMASTPVSLVQRPAVERALSVRAGSTPKSANDELTSLKAVLKLAEGKGAQVDKTIFAIEKFVYASRARRVLTVESLEFLVACAPEHGRNLLLTAGTVGNRIKELLTLEEDRIDLVDQTMFIPAALCKEKVDKVIELTMEECSVMASQLAARPAGTKAVFLKRNGKPLDYSDFHQRIWRPALHEAHREWTKTHGADPDGSTPFYAALYNEASNPVLDQDGNHEWDWLEPHDLRATAVTLMRDAGFTRDQTAARVGHADRGELVDRLYDKGDPVKRAKVRNAINSLGAPGVLSAVKSADNAKRTRQKRATKP